MRSRVSSRSDMTWSSGRLDSVSSRITDAGCTSCARQSATMRATKRGSVRVSAERLTERRVAAVRPGAREPGEGLLEDPLGEPVDQPVPLRQRDEQDRWHRSEGGVVPPGERLEAGELPGAAAHLRLVGHVHAPRPRPARRPGPRAAGPRPGRRGGSPPVRRSGSPPDDSIMALSCDQVDGLGQHPGDARSPRSAAYRLADRSTRGSTPLMSRMAARQSWSASAASTSIPSIPGISRSRTTCVGRQLACTSRNSAGSTVESAWCPAASARRAIVTPTSGSSSSTRRRTAVIRARPAGPAHRRPPSGGRAGPSCPRRAASRWSRDRATAWRSRRPWPGPAPTRGCRSSW